ncbi:MAG: TetR/AcrR family transcriptional regulator [Clostridia bacterium]|nr:TetR/AcrR family transcriptional regulator [Clostridia bacterium]
MKDESKDKQSRLLNNAFKLFTKKGVKDTSIQEIVDGADVAKGTFYLYFKDKYEIRDVLIAQKSKKLFNNALKALKKSNVIGLPEQVIFIINHVIDALSKNTLLLKFISKNLSWGVYNETVNKIYEKEANTENGLRSLFIKGIEENNLNIPNPDVTLFMIIELVSSTCFNSILYKNPLPIDEFKPYLFSTIKKIIHDNSFV